MKILKTLILSLIIVLSIYSCNINNHKKKYQFSIEEVITYQQYKKICKNNCYLSSQVEFDEYIKDVRIYLYKLTKVSNDDSYIKIGNIGSSKVEWYTIFSRYGIYCPTNIFSRTINKGKVVDYNYNFNNLDYSEGEYIKIKPLHSITGLIFEEKELDRFDNCTFFNAIILFNPLKNDFEILILDTKTQEVYLSVEELNGAFKFNPDNKQYIKSDSRLFFENTKNKFFNKSTKFIEINHDTLIDFKCFKK